MTTACQTCGRCAARAGRPGGAARFLALPFRALARADRRLRQRRATIGLMDLDDHLLADIGISRDEVRRAAGGRPLRRPDGPEPAAPALRICPR